MLAGAAPPDPSVELLGASLSLPVLLAPTAVHRLCHPEGEVATARAAARAGTIFCLSTLASRTIEEVAQASDPPGWFQLYVYRDRGLTGELLDRCMAADYRAVLVTVDTPVLGRRERDEQHAFALPDGVAYANFSGPAATTGSAEPGVSGLARYVASLLDPSLSWKDLEWLIQRSRLPVLVKGVVRADDARRSVASGAAGVVVSNHGGRQLDHAVGALDALPDIAGAVGDSHLVLMDGGVRRGTDVLKAIMLGARAVLIGRPYLYALAVGGEDAVVALLEQLRLEIATSMTLVGARDLAALTPDLLQPV